MDYSLCLARSGQLVQVFTTQFRNLATPDFLTVYYFYWVSPSHPNNRIFESTPEVWRWRPAASCCPRVRDPLLQWHHRYSPLRSILSLPLRFRHVRRPRCPPLPLFLDSAFQFNHRVIETLRFLVIVPRAQYLRS